MRVAIFHSGVNYTAGLTRLLKEEGIVDDVFPWLTAWSLDAIHYRKYDLIVASTKLKVSPEVPRNELDSLGGIANYLKPALYLVKTIRADECNGQTPIILIGSDLECFHGCAGFLGAFSHFLFERDGYATLVEKIKELAASHSAIPE